jgi:Ca-activated chloride channel family protein
MTMADGSSFCQTAILPDQENVLAGNNLPGPIARLSIQRNLRYESETAAMELALKYQLVSPYANYIIVAAQAADKKGKELPALRKVPQMMAAGWGGTSTVMASALILPSFIRSRPATRAGEIKYSIREIDVMYSTASSPEALDEQRDKTTPDAFVFNCNYLHTNWLKPVLQITSYNDLLSCNLSDRILAMLKKVAESYDPKATEEVIVLCFLKALSQSGIGRKFNRRTRWAIKKASRSLHPDERLIHFIAVSFANISEDDWGTDIPF